MARPGSLNPDYNENLFPDASSRFMHEPTIFHDRRTEGRRHTPTEQRPYDTHAANWRQEAKERWEEEHPSEEEQRSEWADKMMRAQDAEDGR